MDLHSLYLQWKAYNKGSINSFRILYALISNILIPESKNIVGQVSRKLCIVGFGQLAATEYMSKNVQCQIDLIDAVIILTKTISTSTAGTKTTSDFDPLANLEEGGYDSTYVQLKAATQLVLDPIESIQNTRDFTVDLIKKIHVSNGQLLNQIQNADSLAFLKEI